MEDNNRVKCSGNNANVIFDRLINTPNRPLFAKIIEPIIGQNNGVFDKIDGKQDIRNNIRNKLNVCHCILIFIELYLRCYISFNFIL